MSCKIVAWKLGYFSMSAELKVKVKEIRTVMLRQNSRVSD